MSKSIRRRKYILYGAGKDGIAALSFLGSENVTCFCDNKEYKKGEKKGVRILSFDELKNKYAGETIVITASTPKSVYEITRQLQDSNMKYDLFENIAVEYIKKDAEEYRTLNTRESFSYNEKNEYLISRDKGREAGDIHSYFWQDLWAAKHIFEQKPDVHFDIGSRVDGFIAHLLSFGQKVKQIDIRPLDSKIEGLDFVQADATKLYGIEDNSIESISALCSLEHFGLGRYGDPIDPEACFKCFDAIQNKLRQGGMAYISVPIGIEHLEFNAHRVFSASTIIDAFKKMKLNEFSSTYAGGITINSGISDYDNDKNSYGGGRFGLFWFEKKEL